MIEALVYIAAGSLVVLIPFIYWMHERHKSRRSSKTLQRSIDTGRDEPVSLHPYIDPDICIGSGACVRACPEKNVLGLIENRGTLINPANCIGHGLCAAACPVDAITLVFGTEKRGVDIPHVKGTFETNVDGIYIAGELGGMGLIRNAAEQGLQAVQHIAESLKAEKRSGDALDLLIIGSGPAGIAASLQAKAQKLDFITVDQEDLGGTILTYPRRKLVMTRPMELPLYGKLKLREVRKEALLEAFRTVFSDTGLTVQAGEKVEAIERANGHFRVETQKREYQARRILLAIGRRGSPRKLGVPGEERSIVAYRLMDPEAYAGQRVLVVGGGDSAVEAAVSLSDVEGTQVSLSYRRERVFRIKPGNEQRLTKAIDQGKVQPLFGSKVMSIEQEGVLLEVNGEEKTLPVDAVFIMIGGELPIDFLKKVGIAFERKFGEA